MKTRRFLLVGLATVLLLAITAVALAGSYAGEANAAGYGLFQAAPAGPRQGPWEFISSTPGMPATRRRPC